MKSSTSRSLVAVYLLLFTMALINYLDRVALSVAARPIAAEFQLSPVEMGYLFSSFLWTYLLCLIPAGILADKYGAKGVCVGGMGVWSIATVLTGLVGSFHALFATRLVMGAGEATSYPCANKFIREQVPTQNRGFATTIFNSGAYAGPAVGALFIGWLVSVVSWRVAFMLAGAIGLVWLVPWMIWFRNSAPQATTTAAAPAMAATPDPGVGLKGLLRSTSMWGIAVTQGCAVYTQYLFLTWLPSYLQATKGMNIKDAAIYTALPYACAVLFGMLLGRISDKLLRPGEAETGKRRPMIGAMLLCSSVILAAPFVSNIWVIVLLLAVSLTGIATAISLNMALANDLLDHAADAGKANSIAIAGGNVFGILAPIVTGYLVAATDSYNYAFAAAGVLLLVGALVSQVATRRRIGEARCADARAGREAGARVFHG